MHIECPQRMKSNDFGGSPDFPSITKMKWKLWFSEKCLSVYLMDYSEI